MNDNQKYNAYREIAENRAHAEGIINGLKLAYGETAVVPFYHPDVDSDASIRTIETLIGTSSLHSGKTVFTCSIENDQELKNFEFRDKQHGNVSVSEAFSLVDTAIDEISGSGSIVDKLSDVSTAIGALTSAVGTLTETLGEKLGEIASKLSDVSVNQIALKNAMSEKLDDVSTNLSNITKILDEKMIVTKVETTTE